jgi:Zn-dependent metalloprotease/ligand-binding sensor domain-containing protein
MKKIYHTLLWQFCLAVICFQSYAQPSILHMKERLPLTPTLANNDITIHINPKKTALATISFTEQKGLTPTNKKQWLSSMLQLREGVDELVDKKEIKKTTEGSNQKFRQFYKGLPVEFGTISCASINGNNVIQMEFYSIPDNFNTVPLIDENSALEKALLTINAKKYAWENNYDTTKHRPTGTLVILNAEQVKSDTIILAYKFFVNATEPLSSAYIYVNAWDGSIALINNQLHRAYSNETALATTKYSGRQQINVSKSEGYFVLRQTRNGHDIETLNFEYDTASDWNIFKHNFSKTDFRDTHNTWGPTDDTATEVHFNMQLISDYWKNVMDRSSYDNANATIKSFVHTNIGGGAMWRPAEQAMYFDDGPDRGDGYTSRKSTGPDVGLDVSAHEFGHAVGDADDMPGLVYNRESGALDEGFSDIWGACLENYAIKRFPNLAAKKSVWVIAEESAMSFGTPGFRHLQNPKSKELPDTYYGIHYKDASKEGCPTPNSKTNDGCGVHTNSSILAKWFSLITSGGSGTNDHGYTYNISGLGFELTERIAYNVQMLLTPNSDYHTVMNVSLNYLKAKYGENSNQVTTATTAWRAVGVLDTMYFSIEKTPAFNGITEGFTTIALGKNNQVWVGTSREGLYRYTDSTGWLKSPESLDNKVNYFDMKADREGGIWAAQSGYFVSASIPNGSGGIYYFSDTGFSSKRHYTASADNVPRNTLTSNMRGIWVDTVRYNNYANKRGKLLPQVWAVGLPHTRVNKQYSAGLIIGLNDTITKFKPCPICAEEPWDSNFVRRTTNYLEIVDRNTTSRGAQTIGGNYNEVWVYSTANTEYSTSSWGYGYEFYNGSPAQIMRFNAQTGDSIGVYNASNVAILKQNFLAKAIYFDANGNKWVGLQTGGVAILDNDNDWHSSDEIRSLDSAFPGQVPGTFPDIFPANCIVSNNAIVGDKLGNVYFATNQGLIVFTGGSVTDYRAYKRFTTKDGLPSNVIKALAIDTLRKGVWVATDMGILLWRHRGAERMLGIVEVSTKTCGRDLNYTVRTKGRFYEQPLDNQLIVELSDANGSFASPTIVLESRFLPSSDFDLPKAYSIPTNIPDGDRYKLRARSTNPVTIGAESGYFAIKKSANTVPSSGAKDVIANKECTDSEGWTHYYFDNNTVDESDDIRLLSLKKSANDIGKLEDNSITVKVASTSLAGTAKAQPVINPIITNPFVSMNRYWDVTPSKQPTTPINVRFYYNSQDLVDVNGTISYGPIDHSQLVFYKTNGNPDPTSNFNGATSIISLQHAAQPTENTWTYTQLKDTIHQAEFKVAGFSGGGAGSTADGGPLNDVITPLKLVVFTGVHSNGNNFLQWQTSNEENTHSFEIERSTDGVLYTTITTKAAVGNGNNNYTVTDNNISTGIFYYRLKMIDKNGDFKYSKVIKITTTQPQLLIVSPNPVTNNFRLTGLANIQKIQLNDLSGKTLITYSPNANNQYSVMGLSSGVYILSCIVNDQVHTKKIVIH